MQFVHNEEQQLIRESARSVLSERATSEALSAALLEPGGYDHALWRTFGELGWTGLAIPQTYGGAGLGWVELCILQEEQGRRLAASPFFATVALVAPLIAGAGSEAQRRTLLPRIAAGELRVACALSGPDGRPPFAGVTAMLERRGAGFVLSGASDFVIHGDAADLLLVLARTPGSSAEDGISVVALPAGTAARGRSRRVA